jgi:hypothetical protein
MRKAAVRNAAPSIALVPKAPGSPGNGSSTGAQGRPTPAAAMPVPRRPLVAVRRSAPTPPTGQPAAPDPAGNGATPVTLLGVDPRVVIKADLAGQATPRP